MPTTGTRYLETLLGRFPTRRSNARVVADRLTNPGCVRRQVLDAAGADVDFLAELVGCPPSHQSSFAIRHGNQFERVCTENGLAIVIALVRKHLGFSIDRVRQRDLSAQSVQVEHGRSDNSFRVGLTSTELRSWLGNDAKAKNLLRHAMTSLDIGGHPVFLEQDVLAFFVGGRLVVVEIKSFPVIDGVADPDKVAQAALQTAVYVVSLQKTVAALGHDPEVVSLNSLLILPENFTFTPVGHVLNLAPVVARIRAQLAIAPNIDAVVSALPQGLVLPDIDRRKATKAQKKAASRQAAETLSALPCRFGEACMSCPLFRFCRDAEQTAGSVTTVGSLVANACGDVGTVAAALALAENRRRPTTSAENAVAVTLGRAASVAARYGITA